MHLGRQLVFVAYLHGFCAGHTYLGDTMTVVMLLLDVKLIMEYTYVIL